MKGIYENGPFYLLLPVARTIVPKTAKKKQRFLEERQLLVIRRMLPRLGRISDYVTMTRTCKQGNSEGCYML